MKMNENSFVLQFRRRAAERCVPSSGSCVFVQQFEELDWIFHV